jgi:hypothetical protein
MRFQFHGHDASDAVGYVPPVLDLHGRPLIPARLVPVGHEALNHNPHPRQAKAGVARIFKSGEIFDANENDHHNGGYHLSQFCRSHPDFVVVNRSAHPRVFPENEEKT